MSKLTVNGVRVPIDSCTEQLVQVYADTRAYTGGARKNRLGSPKRAWQVKTPPLYIEDATALAGIVQSRGDAWTFDDATLFSQKGAASGFYGATALTPFVVNSAAADGAFNPGSPPFGGYAVYTGAGNSNVAPTDQATMEGVLPVAAVAGTTGGSVALDTAHKLRGSKSIKLVGTTGGAITGGFFSTPGMPVTLNAPFILSFHVYNGGAAPCPLTFIVAQGGGANAVQVSITVPVGGWYRYALAHPGSATSNAIWSIREALPNQGTLCWFDDVQVEYGTRVTPWVAPGVTNISASSGHPLNLYPASALPTGSAQTELPTSELSVGIWAQMGRFDAQRFLFEGLSTSTSAWVGLYSSAVSRTLTVYGYNESNQFTTQCSVTLAASAEVDDWHHFVVNFYSHPHVGGNWSELYIDGVLAANDVATRVMPDTMPSMRSINYVRLRTDSAAWGGMYNEVHVNPFCLPAGIVSQLYAAQPTVRPTHPSVIVGGSLVGNLDTSAVGSKVSLDPLVAHGTGGRGDGLQTMATLSFALEEL